MWPFKSAAIAKHIAEALAPAVLPSAREKAMGALMELPQNKKMIECYRQIALDPKQVWKVRYKAVEGLKLSVNADGARALLRCAETDFRRTALSALCAPGMPEAVRSLGEEAQTVLAGALRQISIEAETKFNERLLDELGSLQQLLIGIATPEAKNLLPKLHELYLRSRNRLVPKFLERALQSNYHHEVQKALAELTRLDSVEAKAALEKFRSVKSRLVEKTFVPGIGCPDENAKLEVYTSEFGQPKCEEELARDAALRREWEQRHPVAQPKPKPTPPADLFSDNVRPDDFGSDSMSDNFKPPESAAASAELYESSQHYAAASSRGIEEELLALMNDQLDLLKSLHRRGSLAPLAAAMDSQGEMSGLALTTKDSAADDRSVDGALAFFREKFQASARKGELVACAIFYHGCHGPGKGAFNVAPAQTIPDADCIVALLDHCDGQAITCVIQYTAGAEGAWNYAPAYYAPKPPVIFVDQMGSPLAPNRARAPALIRRPAAVSDHGTHPELMTLVESQLEILQRLQRSDSLAPVVATLKPSGKIQTALLLEPNAWQNHCVEVDVSDSIVFYEEGESEKTPAGAIAFFVGKFRAAARNGEIVASAIFFHAVYDAANAKLGLKPAEIGETPDCLVAQLDHRLSQAISLVIRYSRDASGEYHYAPAEHYSAFPLIFNATE